MWTWGSCGSHARVAKIWQKQKMIWLSQAKKAYLITAEQHLIFPCNMHDQTPLYQHLIFPWNVHDHTGHENKENDHWGKPVLMFKQHLPISNVRNVWRPLKRIEMLILVFWGLKNKVSVENAKSQYKLNLACMRQWVHTVLTNQIKLYKHYNDFRKATCRFLQL